MNDTEIRIAVAEYCGWTEIKERSNPYYEMTGNKPAGHYGNSHVPDYTGDLNAMHEAEKLLTRTQRIELAHWLESGFIIRGPDPFKSCFATARQHAEAFLRTVDKWKD